MELSGTFLAKPCLSLSEKAITDLQNSFCFNAVGGFENTKDKETDLVPVMKDANTQFAVVKAIAAHPNLDQCLVRLTCSLAKVSMQPDDYATLQMNCDWSELMKSTASAVLTIRTLAVSLDDSYVARTDAQLLAAEKC